ncbi:MAG TPA: hypothetical protein DCQ98_20890 [Planctomycetaceae bacterium]|nr:hypothetical protein [Planctomycetaceae bacterium]
MRHAVQANAVGSRKVRSGGRSRTVVQVGSEVVEQIGKGERSVRARRGVVPLGHFEIIESERIVVRAASLGRRSRRRARRRRRKRGRRCRRDGHRRRTRDGRVRCGRRSRRDSGSRGGRTSEEIVVVRQ